MLILFLKLGAGFICVFAFLEKLFELCVCDSCTFLYVGFTSRKSFLSVDLLSSVNCSEDLVKKNK